MKAILAKPLKHEVKIISGVVLSHGLGVITLLVPDKKGGSSIIRFKEADYSVTCYEE